MSVAYIQLQVHFRLFFFHRSKQTRFFIEANRMNSDQTKGSTLSQVHGSSVIELLTRDRGVTGSSFNGITALCP